tara:strand:+ start:23197 stop:36075 length:12879 start_codon:yes stop_codon:yes gene_type:complete
MESNKHLVALECFCVKKATATASNVAAVSAKLSCKPAMITGSVLGVGTLSHPDPKCKESEDNVSATLVLPSEHWSKDTNYGGDSEGQSAHVIKYRRSDYTDAEATLISNNTKKGKYIVLTHGSKVYYYKIVNVGFQHSGTAPCSESFVASLWNSSSCPIVEHEVIFAKGPDGKDPWAKDGELYNLFPNGVVGSSLFKIHFCDDLHDLKDPVIIPMRGVATTLAASAFIDKAKVSAGLFVATTFDNHGDIVMPSGGPLQIHNARQSLLADTELKNTNIDKYVGDFGDYNCVQKLFPIEDVEVDLHKGKFVGPYKESGNLYKFIDEGVFVGDYDKPFSTDSELISDDTDFIQPNTFRTEGEFQYKAKVTNVLVKPEHTRFRMRASAPLRNYESRTPPEYTFSNIKLLDPSGNIVVHYNDIIFRGDADQDVRPTVNYTTFSSAPKKNTTTEFYEWQDGYPSMHQKSDYTIVFNVKVRALDEAFTPGFDEGFEDRSVIHETYASGSDYLALDGAPMSTQDQTFINPTKNIRISAIEICNSGLHAFGEGWGPRYENYLPFYMEVPEKGRRLEKKIIPTFMPHSEFDTGIWPSNSSVWYPNDLTSTTNESKCGSEHIVYNITDGSDYTFATLHTTGPHLDSGKLTLKFSPSSDNLKEITKGAFNFGFDQSIANSWYSPSGAFNTENKYDIDGKNGYFVVDSITLKVRAKKSATSRDFSFDVVGYSDDKLLNITPAPSGFLQNPSGVQVNNLIFASEGVHPYASGFYHNSNDFALGGESLSEKDEHYEASGNLGGDHYSLSTYPVVSSTEFQDYEVPLKIYDDKIKLGYSRNYNVSSLFENLFLDIYPIPSGASIADIHLLVRIAPQDGLMLSVEGGEDIGKIRKERSEAKIFPSGRISSNDDILNAGSGYGAISTIENIPHAYSTPSSIKTNYSRRWRGDVGTVRGPFDVDMFGFGFENPGVPYPFLEGYFTFNRMNGEFFLSEPLGLGNSEIGEVNLPGGNYQFDIMKNAGWRFSSGTIFQNHLPGYTASYETTDWTSYSNGSLNFQNDDLYGKIADAFDTAVRVSGQGGANYIDIQPSNGIIDTSGGFSLFMRFTPDQNVSGADYNLFNSGVLFSKWESANSLDFALGYSGGYLSAYAKDIDGNVIHISDTLKYHAYQYPLSVLLTYNDHNQSGLKLYTDNDLGPAHTNLRASSDPFRKARYAAEDTAGIAIGWSSGSGVGMNMFVTEFGLSTWESGVNSGASVIYPYGSGTNIVQVNPDRTHKQQTAEEFLKGIRAKFFEPEENFSRDTYRLWDYVNEDTTVDWSLGDFQYREFTPAFASLGSAVGKRTNRDLIRFDISHHGSGYIQYADFAMPTNVDSGVAYHTQIENDFLRFHLSDTADNFHSVHRRITKNLPVGYKFTEEALVVDTVIEHVTDNEINWGDCIPTRNVVCTEHSHSYDSTIGPKLIVSLYTKRQEPSWSNLGEPNHGLISRDVHYIPASSDIIQFSSKFSYDELTDTSEQWSLFPDEPRYKDFGERYFSQDVDDMFLQYDLVYPSGPPFRSTVNIHSAHVRMDHANTTFTDVSGNFNIFASGGNVLNPVFNIYSSGGGEIFFDSGILFTEGSLVPRSGLNLNVSGNFPVEQSLSLYSISIGSASGTLMGVNISGQLRPVKDESGVFNLVMPEVLGFDNVKVPLFISNLDLGNRPSGGYLDLFTYAVSGYNESGILGLRPLPQNLFTSGRSAGGILGLSSGDLPLYTAGFGKPEDRFPSSQMTLFIDTPQDVRVSMPLHILNIRKEATSTTSSAEGGGSVLGINLFMANYGGQGSDYLMWYNNNFGTSIEQKDNQYASVPVGNEIRGVDLFGFGSCTGNSPDKAIDSAVITHDTVWRPRTCEEGGIFRATATYTNPTTSGFGDTVGYSGNYYGIRKYTGLSPFNSFQVTLNIVTGDTDSIPVPREFEEWEYGHCGPRHFVDAGGTSGCCATDCEQSIVYSGVKLIGDYPLVDTNYPVDMRNATPPSGRNLGDQYGRTVSVVNDLMAVGSPKLQVPFADFFDGTESQIDDAGAIFLYRRGQDVAGRKADWSMEDKLMLPSGYRKDYIERTVENLVQYDQWAISGNKWNIGQEGRQLGYSLDICSSGDRETVVAGAPFAKWSREFIDIKSSGLPVSMVVFTDAFNYSKKKVEQIASVARKWDILYKYFAAPWYGGTNHEFQPELDIKLIVCQVIRAGQDQPPINHDSDFFRHVYIPRMDDKETTDADGYQATYDRMLSGVKGAFRSAFPIKFGPHSGIPPIMGVFREKSNSAGLGAFYNVQTNDNVVDEFLDFYQQFAYSSGVIDPEVTPPHNRESGYFNKVLDKSESWDSSSIRLLNETLNSGNLITDNALRYITSGVGQEWSQPNAYEFQIPPSSGGRVYIFEKESGVFNCVQEIKSFADRASFGDDDTFDDSMDTRFSYGIQYNDRYGHAVSISKNSQIISIGSPFTSITCEIYERDDKENERMYSRMFDYLNYINSGVEKYNMILDVSGVDVAQKVSYHEMNQDHKFAIRTKYEVELYKPIFNYGPRHIKGVGTWAFITNEFCGTSRLGYSTSVSDVGDTVAFGAPTDSTTLFEDHNVWYKDYNTWASYTNAGAVRIFESKKIFPHSGVVELTRFGNLDRTLHPSLVDLGFYDQMGLYFEPDKRPFRRMDFEEIEIPRDAGLAFIITPELNSDSDELVQNIKDWLALGDRTLVLVGNDPVYEDNGVYNDSNVIVNRLLEKLGSRMIIQPANTKYESLQECVSSSDVFNDRWNVTKAFKPDYGHDTSILRSNMFAKGVGDIRINLAKDNLENFIQFSPCDDLNPDICQLPLKHFGDLRAQWQSECIKTVGGRPVKVKYKTNWPFHFANSNPAQTCDDYPESPKPFINRPDQDIVPLLTAAEHLPDEIVIIPARSGTNCERIPCFKTITITEFTEHLEFADVQEDHLQFSIFDNSSSEIDGVYNSFTEGKFIDPEKKNERDPFLQGSGELYSGQPKHTTRILMPDSVLALEESHYKLNENGDPEPTNSDVIIMASQLGENERSFGITGDVETPSKNEDENILFFVNMLATDCLNTGKVLQLGGWTGRSSFKDAYDDDTDVQDTNALVERLNSYNIEVEENFIETDITKDFPDSDPTTGANVSAIWIANPLAKPDDLQITKISNFLARGNKKLIITYSATDDQKTQSIAENVDYICSKLNLKSRPMFIPSVGEYFVQRTDSVDAGNDQDYPYEGSGPGAGGGSEAIQVLNPETIPTTGCRLGYDFYEPHKLEPVDTKVGKFALWPHEMDVDQRGDSKPTDYVPVSGGGDFRKIISYKDKITDTVTTVPDLYKIDARGKVIFPVVKGSGYRMYFNWVSEVNSDYHPVYGNFTKCKFDPNAGDDEGSAGGGGGEGFISMGNTILRDPAQESFDFVAVDDFITVDLSANHTHITPKNETDNQRTLPPFTPRVLSISGCPLPIDLIITKKEKKKKVPCDPPYTEECTDWYEPEKRFVIPGEFRPIKHRSDPYCDPYAPSCEADEERCCPPRNDVEIEDGPVIAAEEFETFSAGINGNARSRIVVVSDSTLIQGQCPQYRSDAVGENQLFIRSLYPKSPDRKGDSNDGSNGGDSNFGNGDFIDPNHDGRIFQFTQKLRGAERGSAAKYYAVSGIPNTTSPLYGMGGVAGNLHKYVDNEDTYDPATVIRPKTPNTPAQIEKEIKKFGEDIAPEFGIFPRFSGDFLNQGTYLWPGHETAYDHIVDAGRGGGMPVLMQITDGKDYLDFEYFTSGCPGDLFGFSVDLTEDKLIVGTPFNAFVTHTATSGVSGIVQWHEIQNSPRFSGIELCENGGAGAAFYFERTGSGTNAISEFLPWEWKQKIKPSSVNVGMVGPSISILSNFGDHNLDADFISIHGKRPDQFGYSVAVDADVIAIGAPNHDFESLHDHSVYNSGEFIRKEFGRGFEIAHHVVHDLGSSGVRGDQFANASGSLVLNNGAVFTFRNEISDWQTRSKSWVYLEKLYPQGHKDRTQGNKFISALVSGCENDHFGWSVGLNRANRGDSDYTLIAGAPFHDFATSGDHPQSASNATPANGLESAGASYTFDGMLRGQTPSVPNEGGWIDVQVFGDKPENNTLKTKVYQPTSGPSKRIAVSGELVTNEFGDIFLEVSGYDPAQKGFIAHRPYVESVVGFMLDGTGIASFMPLSVFGKPNSIDNAWPSLVGGEEFNTAFNFDMDSLSHRPSGMSLFIPGPSAVYVYNNGIGHQLLNNTLFAESGGSVVPLTLSIEGILGNSSGTMNLVASASGTPNSGNLNLNINSGPPKNNLDLNVRGR